MDCDGSNPVVLPGFPYWGWKPVITGKSRDSVNLRLEGNQGSASHHQFYCYELILRDFPCSCETEQAQRIMKKTVE